MRGSSHALFFLVTWLCQSSCSARKRAFRRLQDDIEPADGELKHDSLTPRGADEEEDPFVPLGEGDDPAVKMVGNRSDLIEYDGDYYWVNCTQLEENTSNETLSDYYFESDLSDENKTSKRFGSSYMGPCGRCSDQSANSTACDDDYRDNWGRGRPSSRVDYSDDGQNSNSDSEDGGRETWWERMRDACDENSTDANYTDCIEKYRNDWDNNGSAWEDGKRRDYYGAGNSTGWWGGKRSGCVEDSADMNNTSCDDDNNGRSGWYDREGWDSDEERHWGSSLNKTQDASYRWNSSSSGCTELLDESNSTNSTECDDNFIWNNEKGRGRNGWGDPDWNGSSDNSQDWSDSDDGKRNRTRAYCSRDLNASDSNYGAECDDWYDGRDGEKSNHTTSDDELVGDSYNETAACYRECQNTSLSVKDCMDTNGCAMDSCTQGADPYTCCPSCTELLFEAANCLLYCTPDTIEETVSDFASCFDQNECDTTCTELFARSNQEPMPSEKDSNDTVLEMGRCDTLQRLFSEPVCAITSCCPTCDAEMQVITDVMVNQMFRGFVEEMDECSLTCPLQGARVLALEEVGGLPGSLKLRRRVFNDAQMKESARMHANDRSGVDADASKGVDDSRSRILENAAPQSIDALPCLRNFYKFLPLSPDVAIQSLLGCFVEEVQSHSIATSEFRAKEANPITEAPSSLPIKQELPIVTAPPITEETTFNPTNAEGQVKKGDSAASIISNNARFFLPIFAATLLIS